MIKTVVIAGRTNVGKSALFNCLTGNDDAIVSPLAGTTCDRKYGIVEWKGRLFELVDSGGVDLRSLKNSISALMPRRSKIEILSAFRGGFEKAMIKQTKDAIKEADLLLMVADWQQGVCLEDKDLALVLKKINKPTILVCNKIDKPSLLSDLKSFQRLNLGEPVMFSSVSGDGRSDLLDLIIEKLQIEASDKTIKPKSNKSSLKDGGKEPIRIVMIGKSNVGKSSLFNKILREEIAVTGDVYQTTMDSNHKTFFYKKAQFILSDTPGLLEKIDRKTDIDEIVYQKTRDIIKKADVILLVTDVTGSLCGTDKFLARLAAKAKKKTVIIANKWDVFSKKDKEVINQINIHYRDYLSKLGDAPIVFASAKTGEGVSKILDLAIKQ